MKYLQKGIELLTSIALVVAGIALLSMMIVVVLDVSLKYLLHQPVPGTLEMVSYYFMAACAFLPFAFVQKKEEHITMTLATDWLGKDALRVLVGIVSLVGAAYMFLFSWSSALEAIDMTSIGESTSAIYFEISIWPARWSVPIGTGLMGVWMLRQSLVCLIGGRSA
ncbi:MAG: TRAP transporter small permease [Pseudomonadota bacterium]|nr:TRAP transporter small permease [Pseudomonadota bacterium]